MLEETIDFTDYKRLLNAILSQAIDDYVKLHHPKYREKKYLKEAYLYSIDMLFDPEYRLMHVPNEYGTDMSLSEIISIMVNKEVTDLSKLQAYVTDQTIEYWDAKYIKTIDIPDTFGVEGTVYHVQHHAKDTLTIDYADKTIFLNRTLPLAEQEKLFVYAIVEVSFYHLDIPIKKESIKNFSSIWFRLLKLNNCFTGYR